MKPAKPKPHAGLRHIALFVTNWQATLDFYVDLMGMQVEWHPDEDNIYLCSGTDNLALHRRAEAQATADTRLDHFGFIVDEIDQVDVWHNYLAAHDIEVTQAPKTHRDGARSFYCHDPDGNSVQLIYHPPISTG